MSEVEYKRHKEERECMFCCIVLCISVIWGGIALGQYHDNCQKQIQIIDEGILTEKRIAPYGEGLLMYIFQINNNTEYKCTNIEYRQFQVGDYLQLNQHGCTPDFTYTWHKVR